MHQKHLVGAILFALAIGLVTTPGCSSSTNTSSCAIGKESCSCTQGGACDPGLMCLSSRCVRTPSTTTGGPATTTGAGGTTTSSTTGATVTTGAGGAPVTTGAGGSPGGRGGTGGTPGTGGSPPPADGGPSAGTVGSACNAPTDCNMGLTCVKSTDKTWLNQAGPAHGYCSLPCMNQTPCVPYGAVCVNMAFGPNDPPNGWCLEGCTHGGSDTAAGRAAKCHGRGDVACYQGATTDAGTPRAFCSPTCSQDSDCGTRKCDPGSSACVDTANPGAAIGTKCDSMAMTDTCAGFCAPLAKASHCTQPCVFGETNQCNHTAGALTSGGTHGYCWLSTAGTTRGDLGFCSQECDTVADCSDKADPGAMCDATFKASTNHGVCDWP